MKTKRKKLELGTCSSVHAFLGHLSLEAQSLALGENHLNACLLKKKKKQGWEHGNTPTFNDVSEQTEANRTHATKTAVTR